MKFHKTLVSAVIETLQQIFVQGVYADKAVEQVSSLIDGLPDQYSAHRDELRKREDRVNAFDCVQQLQGAGVAARGMQRIEGISAPQ